MASEGKDRVALWALTPGGHNIALRLARALPGASVICSRRIAESLEGLTGGGFESLTAAVAESFHLFGGHVFIMAAGIVVRTVAPHLIGKTVDPAVVAVDDRGRFSISLVSGHMGGANRLALAAAGILGAVPVITTATDIHGRPAIDLIAQERGLAIENPSAIKSVNMALLLGRPVWVHDPGGWLGKSLAPASLPFPPEAAEEPAALGEGSPAAVWVDDEVKALDPRMLVLRPPSLVAGIGCNRGALLGEIRELVDGTLLDCGLEPSSLALIASIDIKADEAGLAAFAAERRIPVRFFTKDELARVENVPTPSETVNKHVGVKSVCEAAAILASGGTLAVPKRISKNVTVALARRVSTWWE